MRFEFRPALGTAAVTGVIMLSLSGCVSAPLPGDATTAPPAGTPSSATAQATETTEVDPADLSAFEQQLSYEIAPLPASAGVQEIEIPGSGFMSAIYSVTIVDYTAPDFMHFGSAPLS